MGYQNRFATKLDAAVGASDDVITLKTVPTVTSGRLVLEPNNSSKFEIVKYTGIAGNTITGCLRGQGGTTATTHAADTNVQMNVTAEDLQDILDAFASFSETNNDWRDLVGTATVASQYGNRSTGISITGDHTSYLSKGVRLRLPRTGTVPTQSADFNGTTQYASKASPTGITFTDDLTVEAWINADTFNSARNTIIARTNGTVGWAARLNAEGQLEIIAFTVTGTNYRLNRSTVSVPLGRSVHVAAQMDANGATEKMYIDGVSVSFNEVTGGTPPTVVSQSGDVSIGAYDNLNFFDGRLSDVRLWSTLRTEAQIRDNMNQQLTGSETGLVGYWKLNGNFNDSTTNANNMTAVNGAVATYADTPFHANAYAIITSQPIYSGGNTTMTVQTPAGYPIPSETLGTTSYSGVKAPYGFPSEAKYWTLIARYTDDALVTISTSPQSTNQNMTLPSGSWSVDVRLFLFIDSTNTTAKTAYANFSSSSSSTSHQNLLMGMRNDSEGAAAKGSGSTVSATDDIIITAATSFTVYSWVSSTASVNSTGVLAAQGAPTVITARCAYL